MSQEEASSISRKEKKAKRDAERAQQKGKKRKHREIPEPDALPKQDDDDVGVEEVAAEGVKSATKASKKRKAGDIFEDTTADPTLAVTTSASTDKDDDDNTQPKKKRRKSKKTAATTTITDDDGNNTTGPPKKSRFIVFVGNLPYNTTDSSLQKHFAKLQPFTLRHRTDPKTNKSKGFAFLEFENYDRMKTCLKIYHHTMFDPEAIDSGKVEGGPDAGAMPSGTGANSHGDNVNGFHPERQRQIRGRQKETARKINVELTVGGGGGKSDERKEKIKEKNERLNEQRERRAELEKKELAKKAAKEGGAKKIKKTGANADVVVQEENIRPEKAKVEDGAIHPARLAMMGR